MRTSTAAPAPPDARHWLAKRLHLLEKMSASGSQAHEFLAVVSTLINDLVRRPGVTAAFACHDGLLLDGAGNGVDLEALGAIGQSSSLTAKSAAAVLSMGAVRQLLIIGDAQKVALFVVGAISVGVLAPEEVELSAALSVP